MELMDTHCHLTYSPLWEDLDSVIERARLRGVTRIVVPAVDRDSWNRLDVLAAERDILPAYGIHPWVVDASFSRRELELRLENCPARPVAIGEIGLDFKVDSVDRAAQSDALRAQLDVAQERSLPVLLHCRGAFEELFAILESHGAGNLRGVVHAFSRGPQLAMRFVELGFHVAFGGAVTRPGAKRARQSAAQIPLDRLLLETDAPSIGIEGVEAKDVEPGHVRDIAEAIAQLRDLPVEEIAALTTKNAQKLFGL